MQLKSGFGLAAGAGSLLAIAIGGAALAQGGSGAGPDLPYVDARATDIGSCRAPTSHAGTSEVLTCACPAAANDPNASSAVWGTDVYTADSYICATARHAGVIDGGGGQVTLQMLPGQASYEGTRRNGVQTRGYGRYGASYRYVTTTPPVSAAAPAEAAPAGAAVAAVPVDDGLPVVSQRPTDIGTCRAPTSHAGTADVLSCSCPSASNDPNASSAIWGTDIYTADSYICASARHAGVIDRAGGQVTLQMLPGQASYEGTRRNGVETRSYGRYGASYRFVRYAPPE